MSRPAFVKAAADLGRQGLLFARAMHAFVRDGTSRTTFTALSELLVRFRANADSVDHMLRDPDTLALCRERYVGGPHEIADLLRYPPGSLGHELAVAMLEHHYDPQFYRDFYGDEPPEFRSDEEYLRFRVRQTHDIVHVLTGFGMTEFPGELGMQAFLAAQSRRPFSIALVGFGMLRIILRPEELEPTLQQVAKGLSLGFTAKPVVGRRYENDWAKPVERWREELGLVDQARFEMEAAQ